MGKKLAGGPRRRPGNGPTGNSSNNSSSSGSSLVVVNPMHMQSALRAAPSSSKQSKQKPKQGNNTNKKRKADGATDNGSGKKQKKSKRQNDREDGGGGSFTARKSGKRVQKSPVVSTHVSSVVTSAGLFGADDGLKRPISLIVQKEEHLLAGAYWIALSRGAKRSCVVVVPNSMTPQTVAGVFRNVGFQALAIHKKMTMGQRKEAIERLASNMELVSEASQVVLVTPEHFAGATTVCSGADVLLLNVKPQQSYSKFSAIFQVMTGGDVSSYRPELTSALLQQMSARLKLATQITEIVQRLGKSNAKDVDSKWATKLAKGADLSDEDEMDGGDGASSDDEDGAGRNKKKSKGKKTMSPDEQRLQALTEKLVLLVARKLEVPSGKKNQQQQGNDGAAAVASDNNQNGKEKLEVLGLVTLNAAVGASMGDERFSAQTQWMDAASGQQFGGAWDGSVRHGASKDASSLALRKKFCAALKKKDGDKLSEWCPNKNPSDLDTWGGEYGKVCGHNEVVMQSLRPFYPQEVLNSKVCSRMFPAPGNQGFDGCLEHLRLQCMAQKRAMTLWDAEYFIYITGAGQVTWTKKNQLLALSLASLQCAVSNLRAWTLASRGRIPPKRVVEALQICCELGSGDLQSPALEMKLLKRVMSFAIGGSVRLWKQIAKLPRPLEEEIVY